MEQAERSGAGTAAQPANWGRRLRTWHFYASVAVCVPLLFYAVTGMLANHARVFVGEERVAPAEVLPLPADLALTSQALQEHWRTIHPDCGPLEEFEEGDEELRAVTRRGASQFAIRVHKGGRRMELMELPALPGDLPSDPRQAAERLARRFPGRLENFEARSEENFSFDVRSVWGTHWVTVDRRKGRFLVERAPAGPAEALLHLHKGRQSGNWQRVLADGVAALAVAVIITGVLLGLVGAPRRRKLLTLALCGLSLLGLLALMMGR